MTSETKIKYDKWNKHKIWKVKQKRRAVFDQQIRWQEKFLDSLAFFIMWPLPLLSYRELQSVFHKLTHAELSAVVRQSHKDL